MSKTPRKADDVMRDTYDLTGAVRGKFFRGAARLVAPIHLEPEVLQFLEARAAASGKTVSQLVNEILKKDIELIAAVA
jgi:hypothetical protein